jgi:hypothetical protein
MAVEFDLTESQKLWLAILPRASATISIVCSLYMMVTILRSPFCRRRTYHRLMLACTVPIMVLSANQLWGQAAAPVGTERVYGGGKGNPTTCTVQGFVYQFKLIIPIYYAILSFLTFRRIVHPAKLQRSAAASQQHMSWKWELFLHCGVYIFPIVSGIYLITVDGFNMVSQGCGVASDPLGCGEDSGVECTRGPDNIGELQWLLVGLPSIIVVSIPTLVMAYLWCTVARGKHKSIATSLAKQSALYLLSLYLTYIFRWIDAAMVLNRNEYVFVTNVIAEVMDPLQGLWTLLVYSYFRSSQTNNTRTAFEMTNPGEEASQMEFGSGDGGMMPGDPSNRSTPSASSQQQSRQRRRSSKMKPEFSIFDGTNVADSSSPWAAFLNDEGEDDSYRGGKNKLCGEYSDRDFESERRNHIDPSITNNSTTNNSMTNHDTTTSIREDHDEAAAVVVNPDTNGTPEMVESSAPVTEANLTAMASAPALS